MFTVYFPFRVYHPINRYLKHLFSPLFPSHSLSSSTLSPASIRSRVAVRRSAIHPVAQFFQLLKEDILPGGQQPLNDQALSQGTKVVTQQHERVSIEGTIHFAVQVELTCAMVNQAQVAETQPPALQILQPNFTDLLRLPRSELTDQAQNQIR